MRAGPDRLEAGEGSRERGRNVFVVLNARSGSGQASETRKRFLEWNRKGFEVTLHGPAAGEDFSATAMQAVSDGFDVVVACGGDGTVAAVAAALRGTDSLLGIVPLGTGNIVARDLGIPLDPMTAIDLLFADNDIKRVDVLDVDGHTCIMSLGVGISAYVARNTPAVHKRLFGPAAYLWDGLGEIGTVEPRRFDITVDGDRSSFSATEVSVANSGVFANMMLPWERGVRLDDGTMDVFVVSTESARDYPMLVFNVLRGSNSAEPGVVHLESRESVRIECEEALPVQVDGDIIGDTPVTVAMHPGALSVIVPERG
jgi:YegS/Rv2252/BmrU family lipid kinase